MSSFLLVDFGGGEKTLILSSLGSECFSFFSFGDSGLLLAQANKSSLKGFHITPADTLGVLFWVFILFALGECWAEEGIVIVLLKGLFATRGCIISELKKEYRKSGRGKQKAKCLPMRLSKTTPLWKYWIGSSAKFLLVLEILHKWKCEGKSAAAACAKADATSAFLLAQDVVQPMSGHCDTGRGKHYRLYKIRPLMFLLARCWI